MNDLKRPHLRVVRASGHGEAPVSPGLTPSTPTTKRSNAQQLALPGILPSRTLVGTSPAALFRRDLADTLRDLRARYVVDIRLAVEFGSLGLSRRDFEIIVERLGVTYGRFDALANLHDGFTRNAADTWARFRESLRFDPAHSALVKLRGVIDEGPVVLLSESPYHEGSERQLVMEALQQLRPGFTCHHIDPAH